MTIASLPIVGYFNRQRFAQLDPSDAANFYLTASQTDKKKAAMYPSLGRMHINFQGLNQLIFNAEPRAIYKSVKYWYAVVLNKIYRVDQFFNMVEITQMLFPTFVGNVYFTYLVSGTITFACFTDGIAIYVYREDTGSFQVVTDPNAPPNPRYIATFGNRITVSTANSSQFSLSEINLDGASFNPATCFTIAGEAIFAQASGSVQQMGVYNNTLYIFTDFTTEPWSNIPSTLTAAGGAISTFPWKQNSSYNYDFGMGVPNSLSIGFDMMAWISQNKDGLFQITVSSGQAPTPVSSEAVDVLLQRIVNFNRLTPGIPIDAVGFLYVYENTIFYRFSTGTYLDTMLLDYKTTANSLDYNFRTQTWNRCIEANGSRNRIQRHIFFAGRHLVTVQNDSTVYEMTAEVYTNDITNPSQSNQQAPDAYLTLPFRYERVTPIIFENDYSEFITDYVEIDFVWGETPYVRVDGAYANTLFIIAENGLIGEPPTFIVAENTAEDGSSPIFIIDEKGNFPTLNDKTYFAEYKPNIELLWSDDGGISFQSADVREFSQIGQYQWRMRWYQLGTSRNRCYKLIAVSPVPIVILGGVQNKRRCCPENE